LTVKWKKIIDNVKEELSTFYQQGYKPTLRSIFYRLFTKGLIPNTKSAYGSLDKETVKARMDRRLSVDCFSDNSRRVIGDFNEKYIEPDAYIDQRLKSIKDIPISYNDIIPLWHNQPEYVEVWVEKEAMTSILKSLLKDKNVRILPHRGFSSLTYLYNCYQRLQTFKRQGKNIHIVYFGDFDPSGDYMIVDFKSRLKKLGLDSFEYDFQKIAVTPEQIRQYNLPFNPDGPTKVKLDRDSRTTQFIEKYGELYAVEIDALPALIPDEFKSLVTLSVDQFYDKKIYNELLEKHSPAEIRRILKEKVSHLSNIL